MFDGGNRPGSNVGQVEIRCLLNPGSAIFIILFAIQSTIKTGNDLKKYIRTAYKWLIFTSLLVVAVTSRAEIKKPAIAGYIFDS